MHMHVINTTLVCLLMLQSAVRIAKRKPGQTKAETNCRQNKTRIWTWASRTVSRSPRGSTRPLINRGDRQAVNTRCVIIFFFCSWLTLSLSLGVLLRLGRHWYSSWAEHWISHERPSPQSRWVMWRLFKSWSLTRFSNMSLVPTPRAQHSLSTLDPSMLQSSRTAVRDQTV